MESRDAHIATHPARDFSFFAPGRARASDPISKLAPNKGNLKDRSHFAILGRLGRASNLAG